MIASDATETDAGEGRPDDCECSGHPAKSLPCWYCYAEDFDEPNPDASKK